MKIDLHSIGIGVLISVATIGFYLLLSEQRALSTWAHDNQPKPLALSGVVGIAMQSSYSSTFTCPDGTSHTVTTICEPGESDEACLQRHRDRVARAKRILCGG